MFELIRMDLRRMVRGRTMWTTLAVMLLITFVVYIFITLVSSPEGLAMMYGQGAEVTADDYQEITQIRSMTMQQFLYSALLGGGGYLVCVEIGIGVFMNADFSSGFAKNIFSLLGGRWRYAVARGVSMLVFSLVMISGYAGSAALLQPLTIFSTRGGNWLSWGQMMVCWAVIGWAAGMFIQLVVLLFRSTGVLVGAAFLFGSGGVTLALGLLLEKIWGLNLAQFTLFGATQVSTLDFQPQAFVQVLLTGLAWGAGYLVLQVLVLEKRDIV